MAIGDDALAAGFALVSGTTPANQIDTEVNRLADWTANRTSSVTPVAKGGTGSTTAAAARTALGVTPVNIGAPETGVGSLKFTSTGFGRLLWEAPGVAYPTELCSLGYVDSLNASRISDINARVSKSGDTMSGHLYLPASTGASSGYTVAYINGDGRVSRGVSSIKYKDLLDDPNVSTLGNIWPTLRCFTLKADDTETPVLGYIAEELAGEPDTDRFVVRIGGEVESIDFIQLLLAQVAQLNARVLALEAAA
ncbi:hypothetical protein [Microbacterium sp. SLBN-146]|uniref:hypothetical protein n=1 Tax=Microbacterium sp. SLBN-146 TaxID=2768457 RepID=UPI00115320D2|nr:hypothetical protein [Microbacterium sp. SLBN-146]TQJ31943.1 hypothetical protein FBY39_2432 [Microbacterium sp. SLBN-146]